MRALRFHAPAPVETRPLVLENVPDPTPGPGQVLVKVSTCGICRFCASGRENLCDAPAFTGWTVHGGFATSFLAEAARIPVTTHIRTFGLEEANDALIALRTDAIRGAGVLVVA